MSDILKPCPFCGKQGYIEGSERDGFYASCRECYCCVGEAYDRDAMPSHMFQSEEAVTEAWNRRSLATQHHQGVDDLAQRILGALDDFASMQPEEDEDWESWYSAAFDLARDKVSKLLPALAQQPLSSPAGWKLVPIEPTDAMIEAGRMARMNISGGYGGPGGWEAMLSAAPTVGGKE